MKKKTKKSIKKTVKTRKTARKPKKVFKKHRKVVKVRKITRKIKRVKRPVRHRKPSLRGVAGRHKIIKPKVSAGKGTLEQLFESQAKVKLMRFFFRNQVDAFSLKETLKMLRMNSAVVRREIKKLEKINLINVKRKQGRVVYSLNDNFDFLRELQDLVLKSTISSKSELVNDVKKIGNVKLLVLGGIFRNNHIDGVDILIVGDKINQRKSTTFLKNLEAEVGRELNCSVMSAKEFNYRYDMYDRFVRDLINENKDILINKLNLW